MSVCWGWRNTIIVGNLNVQCVNRKNIVLGDGGGRHILFYCSISQSPSLRQAMRMVLIVADVYGERYAVRKIWAEVGHACCGRFTHVAQAVETQIFQNSEPSIFDRAAEWKHKWNGKRYTPPPNNSYIYGPPDFIFDRINANSSSFSDHFSDNNPPFFLLCNRLFNFSSHMDWGIK